MSYTFLEESIFSLVASVSFPSAQLLKTIVNLSLSESRCAFGRRFVSFLQEEKREKQMESLKIISKSIVKARSEDQESTERILLTPWDLQFLLVTPIQRGLIFLKPEPSEQNKQQHPVCTYSIQHLKASFSRTLDFFYPLAGRLAMVKHDDPDNSSSYFIDCNNAGALFVHALADGVTISDIIQPVHVPTFVLSFFQLNGTKNCDGVSSPLLAVQITELDDGIFIAVTFNHAVADGTSLWHFFNSWSEIARGSPQISRPPLLQRWFPQGVEGLIRVPSLTEEQMSRRTMFPGVEERIFHMRREEMVKLKAKANSETGSDRISSLQALISLLWRSITRHRSHLDHGQNTTCYIQVGARPRLELAEEYFGNAIRSYPLTMKAGELLKNGIGYTAIHMNKLVGSLTGEKLTSSLKSWIEEPKLLERGKVATNALVITGSPRFHFHSNDFGWGRPIAARSGPSGNWDGRITLYAGVEEGSVHIQVCLQQEILVALGKDAEFMAAVSA